MACGRAVPNPIAPSGRTVVVSGSMQNDSTPSAWTSDAAVEKRSASSFEPDDDGLLRGQRETAERRGDGHFETRRNPIAVHAAQHVHPHDVLDRIMKEQGDQLEWNDGGQALREIAEQGRQVAVRGDRFRHLYQ